MATTVKTMFTYINGAIAGTGDGTLLSSLNKLKDKIIAVTNTNANGQGGGGEGQGGPGSNDFLSRNTGGVTNFVSQDDVLGAKKGGVIDKLLTAALSNGGTGGGTSNSTTVNVNGSIDIKGKDGVIASLSQDEVRKVVMRIMSGDDASGGKSSNMSAQYQTT